MKRSLLVAVVAGACVVGPAVAQAAPRSGVVVDYGANSHTATVATKSGKLIAVHTLRGLGASTSDATPMGLTARSKASLMH